MAHNTRIVRGVHERYHQGCSMVNTNMRTALLENRARRPGLAPGSMLRRLQSLCAALIAAALFAGALSAAEPTVVTVDLKSVVVERFMGIGVQWDPYEYLPSPEAWKTTLSRVDFMRPGLFRVMLNATSYLRGFDVAGNPQYVWSEGQSGMERLSSLFDILDYAQAKNIDILIGEWSPSRGLNVGGGARAGAADPRWARVHADFAKYLMTVRKYSVIKYFNYMNEPNGDWMWPGGAVDYSAWAQGVRNLRKEFDAHGLSALQVAGPDNSGNWDWLDRCAQELRGEIGAWEMHWYAKDAEVLDGRIEKLLQEKREMLRKTAPQSASQPLFLGESGMIEGKVNGDQQPRVKEFVYGVLMADYIAQVARAGWETGTAWDMDDAMHVNQGGRVSPPAARTLKIWGFWNTQGTAMGHPEDEAIRPWFYTWSLMARLFPKGTRIVNAKSVYEEVKTVREWAKGTRIVGATNADVPGLRSMAGTRQEGSRTEMSFMVVNDGDAPKTVTLKAPGAGRRNLTTYRYFDRERPVDSNGFPVPVGKPAAADLGKGVGIELPSRGVVFLTTRSAR
jgi:hypothetical protein